MLKVRAGAGRNFLYYPPKQVEQVTVVESDVSMFRYAHERLTLAHIPIMPVQAPAEALQFADISFEGAVATLILCSVEDQRQALHELLRVLNPRGSLLLVERV